MRCGVYYYLAVGGGERGEGDAARGSKLCRQTRSRTAVGDCCLVGEAVACWNCSFKTTVILNSAGSEVRVCVVLDRLEEQFVELCCEVFVCLTVMSARVFNPLVMSEMRRMLGRSSSDGSGSTAAVARVRRDLFGPINREDAESFAQKELAMLHQRETEKWGFDFEREVPASVEHPRFRWERVSPQENCPQFYANRRLLAQSESSQKRDASTNTVAASTDRPTTTTLRVKTARKQSQITGKSFNN